MNIVGSKALGARASDTDQVSDSGASFKLSTKNISAIVSGPEILILKGKVLRRKGTKYLLQIMIWVFINGCLWDHY